MEAGKSPPLEGFQNRLDLCQMVLDKKIPLGTRVCNRWHPEIPSIPTSFLCFYDSKSICPEILWRDAVDVITLLLVPTCCWETG